MTVQPNASAKWTLEKYERIAPYYDLLDLPFELGRYRRMRPLLFEGISGHIIDIGIGTGRNIPFYPPGADVTGIDISPAMLARARRRRDEASVGMNLCQMDATRLAFADHAFDAAVATFLFCVLPETVQATALEEIGRVVKPGGVVRLLEYVRPKGRYRRFIASLWEPWMAWAYGAGFDRRTEEHVRETGLEIVEARYVHEGLIKLLILRPPT